ncbi:MAG: hypothetical protein ACREFO_14900, partial [Acetobacteraceae bacterium]
YGDGLVSIDVAGAVRTVPVGPDGKPVKALVTNSGTIVAEGGRVLLTAQAVDGLIQNLVDAGGTISANGVSGKPAGTVLVQGVGGSITIAGTLTADGAGTGGTGGAVGLDATGGVAVQKTARIDASGPTGGGVVAVGTTLARAKGGPGTPAGLTAQNVFIAPGATISADATAAGNGGRVVVLSTLSTADHGAITAEGGPAGGNGGFVEISGHDLTLDGSVNTSAPLGVMGTILLDPYNLQIVLAGENDGDVTTTPVNGVAFGSGNTAPGSTDTVSASVIEDLTGNVTLQAINNLEVSANLALTGTNQSLLMEAGNNLTVDSGVSVSATGNVEMDASSAAIPGHTTTGELLMDGAISAGGNISLSAGTGGILLGRFPDEAAPNGNVSATAGTVALVTSSGFVEQNHGTIAAEMLVGSSPSVSLEGNNAIGTLGSFSMPSGSDFFFNDGVGLTVAGPVSAVDSFVSLSTAGNLILSGILNATGEAVALTVGGSITEPRGAILADTLSGSSGGAALFTGVNAIG